MWSAVRGARQEWGHYSPFELSAKQLRSYNERPGIASGLPPPRNRDMATSPLIADSTT